MSTWSMSCIVSLFVFTGCVAAYTPPPLTTQHPAHPEAMAAPALPPSKTLAYGPSDIPSPQPASFMAQRETQHGGHGAHQMPQQSQPSVVAESMAQHGGPGAPAAAHKSQQSVMGEGKVIAVVPSSSQIVVDHKAIPGFMDAMTMGYRLEPSSLLETVKVGDSIRFTIDTQQKAIFKLEKLKE